MVIAFIIVGVLAMCLAVLCVWLLARRQVLLLENLRLQSELAQVTAQKNSRDAELVGLKTDIAVVNSTLEQREKAFALAQQQMENTFKALAGDALKMSSAEFLKLARATLQTEHTQADKQLELRKKEIEALVQPVKETLEKYNVSLQGIESARKQAYGSLTQQIQQMLDDQQKLRGETARLVTALRRPEVRGQWGEIQLRRVAELAGMIPYCDFAEQVTIRTAEGLLRPDMVVRLPNQRSIIVDAKTPLDAFLSALEAPGDPQRQECLERHAKQIEAKVAELAGKQYQAQFPHAPDFVVLFIAGESFLQAAVERRPNLLESAMEKGVVIATPSTLIALLKAVALGWREEQITENAQHISALGQELHKRLCTTIEHLQRVGDSLGSAVEHYNKLVGSFESQVLVSARRFEEMGVKSAKALPEQIAPVATQPREVKPRNGAD